MEYKIVCEKLDHFGRGIGFIDNKIVFINNLLPKEEAFVKITNTKKTYLEGSITKLLKKSQDRVYPKCGYLNCGCDLKHLKYEKQLEYKEEKVKNIIERYAHITPKINPIIKSDKIWNYRNKITLKVDDNLGYYENKTNKLIPIEQCYLATLKTNKIIKVLNSLDLKQVKEIVIKDFESTMISIKGKLSIKQLIPLTESIYLNDKLVYGKETIKTKIKDLTFTVSKDSFFQVNNIMERLYSIATAYCKGAKTKTALDLYCGTGTLTLLLSRQVKQVTGVEISQEMIKCANENKKNNNIKNAKFICEDANRIASKADIITVDPPRSGLSLKTIKNIIKINPEKIIYISCDLMTLARDLDILKESYNIEEITPVDMFPNTHHVETITLLKNKTYSK